MKLVTAAEMRALEERAAAVGRPPSVLMEDAGLAVAQELWISLGAVSERKVVLLIGPGNNGGDGLVAARHLQEFGANVVVLLLAPRDEDDPNLRQLLEREILVRTVTDESDLPSLDEALAGADAVLDAVLGTGRGRPLNGELLTALLTAIAPWRMLDVGHDPQAGVGWKPCWNFVESRKPTTAPRPSTSSI